MNSQAYFQIGNDRFLVLLMLFDKLSSSPNTCIFFKATPKYEHNAWIHTKPFSNSIDLP